MAKGQKPIKVCLTNQGKDTETPWAEDLGPAPGPAGSRKVRLVNVPFLHAKPTWGDVIVVSPIKGGPLTWDRTAVSFDKITTRIHDDSGRWAMIVAYTPHPDAKDAFHELALACGEHDIVCEGAFGPRDGEPGHAYLAVPRPLTDVQVMTRLRAAALPCELAQIHPPPPIVKMPRSRRPTEKHAPATKAKKPAAKKSPASKPATRSRKRR